MIANPQPVAERYHPRVAADLTVKVLMNGKAYPARAKDLSMAGLYLLGAYQGVDKVTVAIPLPGRELVSICRVARRLPDGVGLEFDSIDWEDMFALARYMHPRLPTE
ncbi:MAG TPA: PilZ domain-containing protein [Myxococcaceae bacterium]|jgi:hypothetical protein